MSKSFEYLICLDFEATCWEVRDSDKAEIIGNFKIYNLIDLFSFCVLKRKKNHFQTCLN